MIKKNVRKKDRKLLNEFHDMRCVINNFCSLTIDPAHIKSKGSGGDDAIDNIIPLCRTHHTEQHMIGHFRMAKKYPDYANALKNRGWVFNWMNKIVKKDH